MKEIDFTDEGLEELAKKDPRFTPRAYLLLMHALSSLEEQGKLCSGAEVLDEFRELALDLFGPMAYTVLCEWGIHRTEDIGDMMYNLVEAGHVGTECGDSREDFVGGYDFEEAFQGPFLP